MSVGHRVVLVATDTASHLQSLARQLSLPMLADGGKLPDECIAFLGYRDDRLQLFPADPRQSGPICVDFASGAARHRLQSGGELIVKAVKGRSKGSLRVVDATAGLGRDSFILAAHGFDVTLLERNTIVAALLQDGLQRALETAADGIVARMHLVQSDAFAYFADLPPDHCPDVIYLDPMFAHNEKTALVKKEMRLFRQLLDDDSCDEAELLAMARANATLRVVVKRALKAPPLAGIEPAYALAGKAIRYDVYPT